MGTLKILQKYIEAVRTEKQNKLSIGDIEKIFLLVLTDFLENKLSLSDFSLIATNLYYESGYWPYEFLNFDPLLTKMLDEAAELDYYFSNKNERSKKIYDIHLKKLDQYSNENKGRRSQ